MKTSPDIFFGIFAHSLFKGGSGGGLAVSL